MGDRDATAPDQFTLLPTGIRACYRLEGDHTAPPVLLIGGLGEDLTAWSQRFVDELASSGFFVIRMDNRDSGRSSFASTPPPGIIRQIFARPRSDAYTLLSLATDAVRLLEHLGVGPTHIVGRSMGGMVAQTIAARFPALTRSLTSLYSTTGHPKIGQPALSTKFMLVLDRAPKNRAQAVQAHLRMTRHLTGTRHPIDELAEVAHAVTAWDRAAGDVAAAVARQIQAVQSSGDRTAELRTIAAPTLVINGDRDLIVDPSGGAATAEAIRHAHHVVIPGMGHHIPGSLVQPIVTRIVAHLRSASMAVNESMRTQPPA